MAITKKRLTGSERIGYGTLTAALNAGDMVAVNPATGKLRAAGTAGDIFVGTLRQSGGADEVVEVGYNEVLFVPFATAALTDRGKLAYALTVDTMDITSTTKPIIGRIIAVDVGVGFWIDSSLSHNYSVLNGAQATTGTAGTAGEVAIAGMTSSGVVIVTPAEDPGANLVISDVVAATGKITVYTKDVTGTPTRAALSGKKVNYLVISL